MQWMKLCGDQPAAAPNTVESLALLDELRRVHQRLEEALCVLEDVIGYDPPSATALAAASAGFAEARRMRLALAGKAFDLLDGSLGAEDRDELERLREQAREVQARSALHSSSWPVGSAVNSIRAYRLAWRAVRSYWLDLIDREQQCLYPLLSGWRRADGVASLRR